MKLLLCGSMLCLSVWGAEEDGNPFLPRGESAFGPFLEEESPCSSSCNEQSPPQGALAATQAAPRRSRENSGWEGMHRPESLLEFACEADEGETHDPHVPDSQEAATIENRLPRMSDSLTLTRQRRASKGGMLPASEVVAQSSEEPRTPIQKAILLPSDASQPSTGFGSPASHHETQTQHHNVEDLGSTATLPIPMPKFTERSWLNWFTCGWCD